MIRTNHSDLHSKTPRTDATPPPDLALPHPEILHLNGRHLVWRATQRPSPGETPRPITWEVRHSGDDTIDDPMTIHADLDREGVMRAVDFREVRGRLNEVLMSKPCAVFCLQVHRVRLRQSLHWQRNLAACDSHILPPTYDEMDGWRFSTSKGCHDHIRSYPLDLPVLRPATNRMMLERREERLWAAYRAELNRWTHNLALEVMLAVHLPRHGPACGMRMVHYWRSPEYRQIKRNWPTYAALFDTPGLLPILDDPMDSGWFETVTRLARLPRREWMERLCLPPTRQVVRLFSRLQPELIPAALPLIRQVFADPIARKYLSHFTCRIECYMLRMLGQQPLPLRWPLLLKLCRTRRPGHMLLNLAEREIDFFGSEPLIGPRILASYRRARSFEDIEKINGTGNWLHRYWQGLFQPGVGDAIGRTTPPLPETETIRHLNRPQELLQLSAIHNLCLEKFIDPIIRGEYALYRIDSNGEFAVAGIKRGDDGGWLLDDIRSARNAGAPEDVRKHFLEWLARETTHKSLVRNALAP